MLAIASLGLREKKQFSNRKTVAGHCACVRMTTMKPALNYENNFGFQTSVPELRTASPTCVGGWRFTPAYYVPANGGELIFNRSSRISLTTESKGDASGRQRESEDFGGAETWRQASAAGVILQSQQHLGRKKWAQQYQQTRTCVQNA
jgi:hypothetical protein